MKMDYVKVSKIEPNPNNPRGINIATQDTKLPLLIDSIRQFGVLVPIVVTPRGGKYFLVDGERRYLAAKALKLETIPAFITDSGLSDSALLYKMFQIHHNREQWGPIQQCKALEYVYKSICRRKEIESVKDEKARVQAVAEELVKKTGIDYRTALDRVKFLRWPKSVIEPLYQDPSDDYWYICEIEDKIVIPALQNYPEYFEKVDVDEVRVALYEKLKHHAVRAATDVRKVTKVFASSMVEPSDRKKVTKILDNLQKDRNMTYEEALEDFVEEFPEAITRTAPSPRRLLGLLQHLDTAIGDFDPAVIKEATGRAKARPRDLLEAAKGLQNMLSELVDQLSKLMREEE